MSVILIGNGPSANRGNKGREVDAFDTVVRFNQFQCGYGFDDHLGSKTDVWVTCADFVNNEAAALHRKVTYRHPSLYRETIFVGFGNVKNYKSYGTLEKKCRQCRARITPIDQKLVAWCKERMPLDEPGPNGRAHAVPSTGLLALTHFLLNEEVPVVHLHGFDFFRGSSDGAKHHYFAQYKRGNQQGWHTGYAERRLVDSFVEEGRVISLIPDAALTDLGP